MQNLNKGWSVKVATQIMNELELYYSNLFGDRNCADRKIIFSFINDLTDVPYLAKEKRNVCESILGYIYMMNATMYCRPSKKKKIAWEQRFNGKVLLSLLARVWKVGGW